ncbi:MAG: hypothetical protein WAK85_03990, partial [Xanthobacteraceae bacterium]
GGQGECCENRECPHSDLPHGRLRPGLFVRSVAILKRNVNEGGAWHGWVDDRDGISDLQVMRVILAALTH